LKGLMMAVTSFMGCSLGAFAVAVGVCWVGS